MKGGSTALGGIAGVGGAAIFNSRQATAKETESSTASTTDTVEEEDVVVVTAAEETSTPETSTTAVEHEEKPEGPSTEEVIVHPTGDDTDLTGHEVEILGYERVELDNDEQADVAVLEIDGHAAIIMDSDIDGEADFIAVDVNDDGYFQEDERETVTGAGIAMRPFQEAYMAQHTPTPEPPTPQPTPISFHEDPLLAEQNMPDFINDADVSDFSGMA